MSFNLQLWFAAAGISTPLSADVIHCHFGGVGTVASGLRLLGLLEGPIVTTFHGHDIRRGLRHGSGTYRLLAREADAVIAISAGNRRALQQLGFHPSKIVDHPVGIDVGAMGAARDGRRPTRDFVELLTVARLVPEKSLATLLDALSLVRSRHPRSAFRWRVIGDGPLLASLLAHAAQLGLQEQVSFEGSRTQAEVASALRQADMFILSSIAEVLPVSLMEAHAAGLPVIATRVGDVESIVHDGKTGLIVPPSDPAALADAIGRLLGDPDLRGTFGRAGRDVVTEAFDIHRLNDRLENLLRRLADASGRPST